MRILKHIILYDNKYIILDFHTALLKLTDIFLCFKLF